MCYQKHTVIVGKGSNTQKCWKTKEFVGFFSEEQQTLKPFRTNKGLMNNYKPKKLGVSENINTREYCDILFDDTVSTLKNRISIFK